MTSVLIRRGEDTHTGRREAWGDRDSDWRDASTSQGRPSMAGSHQKLEEARRILPWSLQRERSPDITLISDF